jgi:hypothetical protein
MPCCLVLVSVSEIVMKSLRLHLHLRRTELAILDDRLAPVLHRGPQQQQVCLVSVRIFLNLHNSEKSPLLLYFVSHGLTLPPTVWVWRACVPSSARPCLKEEKSSRDGFRCLCELDTGRDFAPKHSTLLLLPLPLPLHTAVKKQLWSIVARLHGAPF